MATRGIKRKRLLGKTSTSATKKGAPRKLGIIHKANPKTLNVKFRQNEKPVHIKKKICQIVDWRPGYSNIPGTVVPDTVEQDSNPIKEVPPYFGGEDIWSESTPRRDTIMTIAAEIIHSDNMWRQNHIFHATWRRIKADVTRIQWNNTPYDEYTRMPTPPEPIKPDRFQGREDPYYVKPWQPIRTSLKKFLYYPGATEQADGRDWFLACEEIEKASTFRHDATLQPAEGRTDNEVCRECHQYSDNEESGRADWCSHCMGP